MSRISRQVGKGVRSRQPDKVNDHSLQEKLIAFLERDERVVVLASSLATHSLPAPNNLLAELAREVALRFPARFYGLGELLADLVPTVTRLALEGKQPLVLLGSADLARSYAGLSALCAQRLGVVFLLAAGPGPGQTWRARTANDLAILRTLPKMYIGMPSSLDDLIFQLDEACQNQEQPIAIYYRSLERVVRPASNIKMIPRSFGIGKSTILKEGKDLALLSSGLATAHALAVANRLDEAGHQTAVIDVRWIRPLDEPLLAAVAHHFPRLITLEEGGLEGGLGTAVLEMLEQRGIYETRLKRLELNTRPNLPRLVASISSFLDTLERDEGLILPLSKFLGHLT